MTWVGLLQSSESPEGQNVTFSVEEIRPQGCNINACPGCQPALQISCLPAPQWES